MADFARSAHPGVAAQLARLEALSPGGDRLGLERISALLERLGNPHLRLPPLLHVAGTNGKGSTCAFLRAALEAANYRVHVFTSPHLVRFNERIRLAGQLMEDDLLARLLEEVLDASDSIAPSFFEATAAAAFLAFARTPADALVLEVGMGGRLDATNVVPRPLVTGIAALGFDHQQWLGSSLEAIAGEKAGIAKAGVPLVTLSYPAEVSARIRLAAEQRKAPLLMQGGEWHSRIEGGGLHYCDASGELTLPLPALPGRYQADNAALAIAMLRHQQTLDVPPTSLGEGLRHVRWPGRLQKLRPGPLIGGREVWLDGGHNGQAAEGLARSIADLCGGRPLALVTGILSTKDPASLLSPFRGLADQLFTVGFDHPLALPPASLAELATSLGFSATACASVADALARLPGQAPVLIAGSLYLAGEVLALNDEVPD
jgi:dihydrofolate synthase/folylpolyglutamate synthase